MKLLPAPSKAQVLKSWIATRANKHRLFDVTLHPLILFLSVSLLAVSLSKSETAFAVIFLGVIGWRVLYHFCFEVNNIYMTDYWEDAIDHLMFSPYRAREFFLGGAIIAVIKTAFVTLLLFALAALLFHVPAFDASAFLTALAILAVFGFELGVIFIGISYVLGSDAFALTFTISDVVALISGVFYPLALLPSAVRVFSSALPSSHAFSLIKSSYGIEQFDPFLALATLAAWGIAAFLIHKTLYERARKNGTLLQLK